MVSLTLAATAFLASFWAEAPGDVARPGAGGDLFTGTVGHFQSRHDWPSCKDESRHAPTTARDPREDTAGRETFAERGPRVSSYDGREGLTTGVAVPERTIPLLSRAFSRKKYQEADNDSCYR